ncbi:MAG: hypothetical protein AcusKO_47430 [Acuticoccus sp.]
MTLTADYAEAAPRPVLAGGAAWGLAAFDPAERFVLHCLAGDATAAGTLLDEGFDLERMVRFALDHEVVGELAAFCERSAMALPDALCEGLRFHTSRLAAQRDKVERETARLAAALGAAGLVAVFAKGAVASALYREVGETRTVKDLDVYIALDDMEPALAALPNDYALDPRAPPVQRAVRDSHHLSVWASREGLAVEIHWGLAAPRHALGYDLDAAMARRVPVRLGTGAVDTLRADDAIAFWSLELAKDSWASCKKILDFARCVAAAGENALSSALAGAEAAGTARVLRIGLLLAERLTLLTLSSRAAGIARGDRTAARISDALVRRLSRTHARPSLALGIREGLLFARKHDTAAAQLRHVWNIIVVYRVRCWLARVGRSPRD